MSGRRLSLSTLASVPASIRPPFDPASIGVGIVHLGIGAFHRAHQAAFTQDALAAAPGDWGICGVTQRSGTVYRQLAPQDGLYTLLERSDRGTRASVVGVVREVLDGSADPAAVVERIASPEVHVVTLTVTEKGYRLRPGTSGLDLDDPALRGDLEVLSARAMGPGPGDEVLRTPIGQLLHGVWWRVQAGGPPLTVLSCDNLRDNGGLVRRLLEEGAGALADPVGGRLSAWMSEGLATPSTMVDRMVPKAGPAEEAAARTRLGLLDLAPVLTEIKREKKEIKVQLEAKKKLN